ncbi:hypothetical protein GGI23_005044 [Coemansia sp. RSA 2559]|nr:hypothetical protein GGI23_005044 [Coemansia sp. RSA 2559]KAJ2856809.1 hypothetical protein GGI22_003694 [Coemansia erecta]
MFRDDFQDKVRDEMLPLVLGRIAESINEKDYDELDDLMTPYLAKLYKHAIADLSAQGFRLHLEIDVQKAGSKDDYSLSKIGDPAAYDYTIPFLVRNSKYAILRSTNINMALAKGQDGIPTLSGSRRELATSVGASQWLAVEFGFVVNANVKVDLYKGGRIVDSDSGMMQIPVAVSSPHYFGVQSMMNAISGEVDAQEEEPFRWRVCDLFYIADWNNANDIAKAKESNSR